jgi:hypothetical protein
MMKGLVMKTKICIYVFAVLVASTVDAGWITYSYNTADVSTVLSPHFSKDKKHIAIINEIINYDARHLFHLAQMQQSFTRRGFTVVERFQIGDVIDELKLSNSGLTPELKDDPKKEKKDDTLTPAMIKKIGKMYNVEYLCFVSRWINSDLSYIRIIDIETLEVVATSISRLQKDVKNVFEIMTRSLNYAFELFDNKANKPVCIEIYETLHPELEKKVIGEFSLDGIKYKVINVTTDLE